MATTKREFSSQFLGPARVRSSITTLASCVGIDQTQEQAWVYLQPLQHADLSSSLSSKTEHVWYEGAHDQFVPALGSLMGGVSAEVEAIVYERHVRPLLLERFFLAMALFEQRFPDTFSLFNILIRYVVFAGRVGYSGGTVSNRIGLIWLAPTCDWSVEQWLENLVHEFVHNALFLEDMVHGVLVAGGDRLEAPDALAMSAIRQEKRGYDKSYHSAFVSLAIIELYEGLDRFDLGEPFLSPLIVCLGDVVQLRQFATPNGQDLLAFATEAVLQRRQIVGVAA